MTAQIGDTIKYEGERYIVHTEILKSYFLINKVAPKFKKWNTAIARGYIAY